MVDAVSYASSVAGGYASSAQQTTQRSQTDTQAQAGATRDAQRVSGAQTRSREAVQPAAQNDNRDTSGSKAFASAQARPDASTGRGQQLDIYA